MEMKREDRKFKPPDAMEQAKELFPSPSPLKEREAQMVTDTPSSARNKGARVKVVVRTHLGAMPCITCCACLTAWLQRHHACRFKSNCVEAVIGQQVICAEGKAIKQAWPDLASDRVVCACKVVTTELSLESITKPKPSQHNEVWAMQRASAVSCERVQAGSAM